MAGRLRLIRGAPMTAASHADDRAAGRRAAAMMALISIVMVVGDLDMVVIPLDEGQVCEPAMSRMCAGE